MRSMGALVDYRGFQRNFQRIPGPSRDLKRALWGFLAFHWVLVSLVGFQRTAGNSWIFKRAPRSFSGVSRLFKAFQRVHRFTDCFQEKGLRNASGSLDLRF